MPPNWCAATIAGRRAERRGPPRLACGRARPYQSAHVRRSSVAWRGRARDCCRCSASGPRWRWAAVSTCSRSPPPADAVAWRGTTTAGNPAFPECGPFAFELGQYLTADLHVGHGQRPGLADDSSRDPGRQVESGLHANGGSRATSPTPTSSSSRAKMQQPGLFRRPTLCGLARHHRRRPADADRSPAPPATARWCSSAADQSPEAGMQRGAADASPARSCLRGARARGVAAPGQPLARSRSSSTGPRPAGHTRR